MRLCSGALHQPPRPPPCQAAPPYSQLLPKTPKRSCKRPCHRCRSAQLTSDVSGQPCSVRHHTSQQCINAVHLNTAIADWEAGSLLCMLNPASFLQPTAVSACTSSFELHLAISRPGHTAGCIIAARPRQSAMSHPHLCRKIGAADAAARSHATYKACLLWMMCSIAGVDEHAAAEASAHVSTHRACVTARVASLNQIFAILGSAALQSLTKHHIH